MSLSVRTAVAADAQRVSDLLAVLGYELTLEQVERERHQRGTEVLVAEQAGGTRGVLAMHTRRHFQLASVVSSIDALVVDPAHRNEGVGTALVRSAVEVAERSGAALIDLNSAIERVDARRFYEGHGFDVVSHHFRRWLAPS